jgi:serine/threonine protein kinase
VTLPELSPGRIVAKYSIQGTLGRTSWAETYVAITEPSRLVALRALDKDVANDPSVVAEIERVRAALASIPEHLVLPVIDEGEDIEVGVRFVVTPLSDHPSLADLVEICALSASETVGMMQNLATAVDAAHTAGVPHLALKPTNLFVGPPPTHSVRIADFGADAQRRAKKDRRSLAWLAPEQLEGEAAAGPGADVFTAALVAFFAMTGKSYWSKLDADDDALAAEVKGPRARPSERAREVGGEVPPSLDDVLVRALAIAPADRYASVRAFTDALGEALAPSKPAAQPAPERHVKATQRLQRFHLPVPAEEPPPPSSVARPTIEVDQNQRITQPVPPPASGPASDRGGAQMDQYALVSAMEDKSGDKKTTKPPAKPLPRNATVKLRPAKLPESLEELARETLVDPLVADAKVSHKHPRFKLPEDAPQEDKPAEEPKAQDEDEPATQKAPPASGEKPTAPSRSQEILTPPAGQPLVLPVQPPAPEGPPAPAVSPTSKPAPPQKPATLPAPRPAAPQKPAALPAPRPAVPQKPATLPTPKPAAPPAPEPPVSAAPPAKAAPPPAEPDVPAPAPKAPDPGVAASEPRRAQQVSPREAATADVAERAAASTEMARRAETVRRPRLTRTELLFRGLSQWIREEWESGDSKRRIIVVSWAVLIACALVGITLGVIGALRGRRSVSGPAGEMSGSSTAVEGAIVSAPSTAAETAATGTAQSSQDAPLAADESELEVVCTPDCDRVAISGKPMTTYPRPVRLAPGPYFIGVSWPGSGGQYRNVTLRGGEKETVTFTLGKK